MSPACVDAHVRLGRHRSFGDTRVAVYADDDPSGVGPALQIVTDNASMLMDSVTVLLHRLGVAYTAIMNPVFRVRRGARRRAGGDRSPLPTPPYRRRRRRDMDPRRSWRRRSTPRRSPRSQRLLPSVLADARQVALDSASMAATLRGLADELDSDPERPVPRLRPQGRRRAAAVAGRRPFRAARLPALPGARRPVLGRSVQPSRRAAVAHRRASAAHGQRRSAGAGAGHHVRATCATARTRTSWWSANMHAGTAPSSTASSGCSRSPP